MSTDRVAQLERHNRWLSMIAVGALAFGLGALWGGRGEAPTLLPRAEAGDPVQTYKSAADRPAIILVPSDSGASLYEYVLMKDGSYAKRIWG